MEYNIPSNDEGRTWSKAETGRGDATTQVWHKHGNWLEAVEAGLGFPPGCKSFLGWKEVRTGWAVGLKGRDSRAQK